MKEVGHRIDKDASWLTPCERQFQPLRPQLQVETLFVWVTRYASKALREGNLKPGQMTDVTPNENGFIGPAEPPEGASTFGDPTQAPLAGHYHRLRAATMLPEGLGIKADGIDIAGGTRQPTHHTIYPTRAMLPAEFDQLFQSLPWEYGGRL